MDKIMRRYAGLLLGVWAGLVGADEYPSDAPPRPPTEAPTRASDAENNDLEPEITIKEKNGNTMEEYRVKGQLYMIKIIPKKGAPYFLVDTDGDGQLEKRLNDLAPGFLVPSWIILKFR